MEAETKGLEKEESCIGTLQEKELSKENWHTDWYGIEMAHILSCTTENKSRKGVYAINTEKERIKI